MSESVHVAAPALADDDELIQLFAAGHMQKLLDCSAACIAAAPEHAFAWKANGLALLALGRRQPALTALRQALELHADDAEGWANLGILLGEENEPAEAEQAFRQALALAPDLLAAQAGLGLLLVRLQRDDEAAPLLLEVLQRQPQQGRIQGALGEIAWRAGELAQAEILLQRELTLAPTELKARTLLGQVWQRQGRLPEALALFRQLVTEQTDFAEGWNHLGLVLQQGSQYAAAEEAFRRVTELRPQSAQAFSNLGNALQAQNRFIEAQSCYRRALALAPNFYTAHSNLLHAMHASSQVTPTMRLSELRRFGDNLRRQLGEPAQQWSCPSQPAVLRVGLLSSDLRRHPVAVFLLGLLAELDRRRIEIHAYADVAEEDEVTAELREHCLYWQDVAALDDEALAAHIHADGIHILIDLAGHTADNRLAVFARRPAPVQLSWPGYWASTGVDTMDYFLADRHGLPPALQAQFTERIHYLPDTRLCFTPPAEAPAVASLPLLRQDSPTLGSFQGLDKLSDQVLQLWAQVLTALPEARLRLQTEALAHPAVMQQLAERLAAQGIAAERVSFHPATDYQAYLAAYGEIDLVLDTFPYSGGAKTCEALWMGVPTLTLQPAEEDAGLIARQGAALLHAAGLEDWVAESPADYVAKAVAACSAPQTLAELRRGLRARVAASPLCNAPRFARAFEEALWAMWTAYEGGRGV